MIALEKILVWDIETWSRALHLWREKAVPKLPENARGLEIGAHQGGLTAWFAQLGFHIVCSDIAPVQASVKAFHQGEKLGHLIDYQTFSAINIPYPDQTFDFVLFKSVLGAVGRNGQAGAQQKAIMEMYRVLKPGGILFFAENLCGSLLHQLARKIFVPWGKSWRYISLMELQGFLGRFDEKEIQATGFFAAFLPRPQWLKTLAAKIDVQLSFIPFRWRYVGYGFAIK